MQIRLRLSINKINGKSCYTTNDVSCMTAFCVINTKDMQEINNNPEQNKAEDDI